MTLHSRSARCHKIRYPSRSLAERTRKRIERQHDERLRVYGCPQCGGFHLTSQPKVGRRDAI